MNIILVNLTRFGDLLQSQAAVRALARLDSTGRSNRICLVCLSNFASTGTLLDEVDLTRPLPRGGFMEKLSGSTAPDAGRTDWALALAELWQWRETLWHDFEPDLVCNLTPTVSARLLARYLAEKADCALSDSGHSDPGALRGFGLDAFGFSQNSPWGTFLQSASRKRSQSPFNVVDLFRAVAGSACGLPGDAALRPLATTETEAMRQRLLGELAAATDAETAEACRGFVAFQLGASAEQRRWPLEYFAWLGRRLWDELRLVPVLLGSGGESELARRYDELNQQAVLPGLPEPSRPAEPPYPAHSSGKAVFPHISLIGRTGLAELAAALKVCSLLVSNDTGTLHLAAGLERPVLGIFLATAQPWDTGPSLPGSLCLEPDLPCHPCAFNVPCPHNFRCREVLRPEAVWRLMHNLLTSSEASSPQAQPNDGSRVWLTRRDEHGFLYLESLSGHEDSPRTLWFMEQRDFLRQFLDRNPLEEFHYQPPETAFQFPPAEREKLAAELEKATAQIGLLLEQGALLQRNPLPMLRERFLATVGRIAQAFEQSEYLGVLNLLWHAEVQEQGGDLLSALRCAAQYHNLCSGLLKRIKI
ncbi:MAG: glycosyltransferase family 9 protein [Deltaproteobacteria bacterium]|jgi:ADP-heptose:LPS heptosyltransferase|nr:glycosyltransferase family 9 protein [Deltaproteobacteria bacterium]